MPLFSVYYNGNKLLAPSQALIVPLISLPGSKIKWLFKNHLSQGVPQAFERWAFFHVKGLPEVPNTLKQKFKSFPIKIKKCKQEHKRRIARAAGWPAWHAACHASTRQAAAELALQCRALPEEYGTHPLHFFHSKKYRWAEWTTPCAWQLLH